MNYTNTLPLSAYPIYHYARAEVIPGLSDKYTSILAPIAAYWILSLFFHTIDTLNWPIFEQHRIHESEEAKKKNRVTAKQVIIAVIFQQIVQTALAFVWLEDDSLSMGPMRNHFLDLQVYEGIIKKITLNVFGKTFGNNLLIKFGQDITSWIYWWGVPIFQFFFASFVMDTWQYFFHRYFHTNKFLYKHVHSWHHRLYVPYSFGALYNHPLEGFVFDTLGATIAHSCSLMTMRQGIFFFAISTAKTVDDHCGFAFPWDPLQHLFGNNADYHDIHHQIAGLKKNFSQPYFIHFDYFLGTRMTRKEFNDRKLARASKGVKSISDNSSEVNGPNEVDVVPTSEKNGIALKEE